MAKERWLEVGGRSEATSRDGSAFVGGGSHVFCRLFIVLTAIDGLSSVARLWQPALRDVSVLIYCSYGIVDWNVLTCVWLAAMLSTSES